MGLQIRRAPSVKFRAITTLIAIFALVAQPLYGSVSYQVTHAASKTVSTPVYVEPNSSMNQAKEYVQIDNTAGAQALNLNNIIVTELSEGSEVELYTFKNITVAPYSLYQICAYSTPSCDALWPGGERLNNDGDTVNFYLGSVAAANKLGSISWTGASANPVSGTVNLPIAVTVISTPQLIGTNLSTGKVLTGDAQIEAQVNNLDVSKPVHVDFSQNNISKYSTDMVHTGGGNVWLVNTLDTEANLADGTYDVTLSADGTALKTVTGVVVDNSASLIVPKNPTQTTATDVTPLSGYDWYSVKYTEFNANQASEGLMVRADGTKATFTPTDKVAYLNKTASTPGAVDYYYNVNGIWYVTHTLYANDGNLYKVNGQPIPGYVNKAPRVTIDIPSDKYVANRSILKVSGTATDNETRATRVAVYVKEAGTDHIYYNNSNVAVNNGTWSVNFDSSDFKPTASNSNATRIPTGTNFYIFATAYDTTGKTRTAKKFNLIADNVKPTAEFTSATNPTANKYYNHDFKVGYKVSDNYKLDYVDVTLFDTNPAHSNHYAAGCWHDNNPGKSNQGTCTVKLGNLPDGEYQVRIQGKDAAGLYTVAATRTIYIDNTPPTVQITSPTSNSNTQASVYASNYGSLTISGTETDVTTNMSVKVSDIENHGNVTEYVNNQVHPDANGKWSVTIPRGTLTDGHLMQVIVSGRDRATNIGSDHAYFTVDSNKPNVSFVKPADNSFHSDNMEVAIDGQDDVNLTKLTIHLYHNDSLISHSGCASKSVSGRTASYTCIIDTSNFSDGTYKLLAAAEDGAGNVTTASHSVKFDNTGPNFAVTSAASGAVNKSGLLFTGTASPQSDGNGIGLKEVHGQPFIYATLYNYANGTRGSAINVFYVPVNGGTWTLDGSTKDRDGNTLAQDLTSGNSYRITFKAQDQLSNQTSGTPATFSYGNIAPTLQDVTVAGTGTDSRTISGTTDPDATVYLTVDGVPYTITPEVDGSWTQDIDTTGFTYGLPYTYTVYASDPYGNDSAVQTGDITIANPGSHEGIDGASARGLHQMAIFAQGARVFAPTPVASNSVTDGNGEDTAVLGTKTTGNNQDAAVLAATPQGWKIFGLAWYWWLLILAIIASIVWWIIAAARRRAAEDAY